MTTTSEKKVNAATQEANTEAVLNPRFYTTDFKALNKLDFGPVRDEWKGLMAEFRADANTDHFKRDDEEFRKEIQELSPELYEEFMGFMISSVTSEYSGCALYNDIKKEVDNEDVAEVMGYMARDESRHAGFINKSLADFDMRVNLGFLRKAKKVKYFRPKFIYYATYLSEKIGYARYITIYRQFERHPEKRFHPMFRWFKDWCNDEFRHGEVFALMLRANPHLLRGHNRLWIRFFLLAVYATMYVRDHMRPAMHEAMGFTPTDYDYEVFRITSKISEQVFPFTLNIDDPRFRAGMERLRHLSDAAARADARGGVMGKLKKAGCAVGAALTFARMYMLPVNENALPETTRLVPTW
ncbi:MAG: magnesium-protoporphyrin IX monomethyl ester (oxidative) cyclase [Gammaproteobacteria bacterium]